jgi:hypothetical protein
MHQAYHDWALASLRERSMLQGARDEGITEGEISICTQMEVKSI